MKGYFLFERVFYNLNDESKKIILRNIFSIKDVSSYSVFVREKRLLFRFFSEAVFYQFVFDFGDMGQEKMVSVISDLKVINIHTFVWNYATIYYFSSEYYDIFVKILTTRDEYLIYSLIRFLL